MSENRERGQVQKQHLSMGRAKKQGKKKREIRRHRVRNLVVGGERRTCPQVKSVELKKRRPGSGNKTCRTSGYGGGFRYISTRRPRRGTKKKVLRREPWKAARPDARSD